MSTSYSSGTDKNKIEMLVSEQNEMGAETINVRLELTKAGSVRDLMIKIRYGNGIKNVIIEEGNSGVLPVLVFLDDAMAIAKFSPKKTWLETHLLDCPNVDSNAVGILKDLAKYNKKPK